MARVRRFRSEIIMEMLEASETGILKTRLMYAARLSYPQLVTYLQTCLDAGLIKKQSELYKTTLKGRQFIQKTRELQGMLKPEKRLKK